MWVAQHHQGWGCVCPHPCTLLEQQHWDQCWGRAWSTKGNTWGSCGGTHGCCGVPAAAEHAHPSTPLPGMAQACESLT